MLSFIKSMFFLIILICPKVSFTMEDYSSFSIDVNDSRWKIVNKKSKINVYSMEFENSDVLAFKAHGILNANVGKIMEALRNVEDSVKWMPNLKEKVTVRNVSDLEAITYSVNNIPFPFRDRDMVLRNVLSIDEKRKLLVVNSYSVQADKRPPHKKRVRAQMRLGQTLLIPIDENRTEVYLMVQVDPMGNIPTWIVNFVQKSIPRAFLKSVEKRASEISTPTRQVFLDMINKVKELRSTGSARIVEETK